MATLPLPSPGDELEARVTALLLGELPPDQAAALRQSMAQDPALAALHARLAQTIDLVREAALQGATQVDPPPIPPRLSASRRERLLRAFRAVPALEPQRREIPWFIPMSLAALLVAMISSVVLWSGMSARRQQVAWGFWPKAEPSLPASRPTEPPLANEPAQDAPGRAEGLTEWSARTTDFSAISDAAQVTELRRRLSPSAFKKLEQQVTAGAAVVTAARPELRLQALDEKKPTSPTGPPTVALGQRFHWTEEATPTSPAPPAIARGEALESRDGSRRDLLAANGAAPGGAVTAAAGELRVARRYRARQADALTDGVQFQEAESAEIAGKQIADLPTLGDTARLGAYFSAKPSGQTATPAAEFPALVEQARPIEADAARAALPEASQQRALERPNVIPKTNERSESETSSQPLERFALAPPPPAIAHPEESKNSLARASGLQSEAIPNAAASVQGITILDDADVQLSFDNGVRKGLGAKAESAVQVQLAPEKPGADALSFGAVQQPMFNPYFRQTEREKIKSRAVLSQVAERLNLKESWAAQAGVERLSDQETYERLARKIEVRQKPNSTQLEILVTGDQPEEAGRIAQTVADTYRELREKARPEPGAAEEERLAEPPVEPPAQQITAFAKDAAPAKAAVPAPVAQPEVQTSDHRFSTFSLNVTDVSFKLAAASLEQGARPEPASIRSEEFLNAFDYRDPEPPPGNPIALAWERARSPFAHGRDLLRLSIKTAAQGRPANSPLNLVLLLDRSGSMERADRVQIVQEALRILARQLQAQDRISVITFARTARLWAEGVAGDQAEESLARVGSLTPEGGTNLEAALDLAYQTATKQYLANGINRVVVLTDGAANLGDVNPASLQQMVDTHRRRGIALDCFGIGWEGFDDDLLQVLSSHGDGRYGFLNTPEEAAHGFAGQLAGALQVAAADVKVQVEFNPGRVTAFRQIGYAKHQLTQEQFRDNTVDAAELGAAESGNALYVVQVDPNGQGSLGTVRVRFKTPGTAAYSEQEWTLPYAGNAPALDEAGSALRLAAVATAFSEWLAASPYAAEVTPDRLLALLQGVPETYAPDPRPKKLEWMIRQSK